MHIKTLPKLDTRRYIRYPTHPQLPKFQPLPARVDQPHPPTDCPTIHVHLEIRLPTRLPHRRNFLPRASLLDRPALSFRKHLPDRIRLSAVGRLSRGVPRHFFCAVTWPAVEIRSALHLHRASNLDRTRMGM